MPVSVLSRSFHRWFDVRAVVLACALAVAAALPGWSTLADRREEYFFDVTLTSTTAGSTRVFWDNGRGFNDHDSSVQPLRVEAAPVTYRYLLPYGVIRGLRFAAIDRPGRLTLTNVQVVGPGNRVVRRFTGADLQPDAGYSVEPRGDGALVLTTDGRADSFFAVALQAPLRLPATAQALWRAGSALALLALLVGLALATPLGDRLAERLRPVPGWLGARPRRTIMLVAAVAVAWQTHPVLFQGRSFVSPGNGSLMLYGDMPTVPGSNQREYTDGMASDVGAMLFQHLYYPMLQHDALLRDHELPLWNRSSLCGVPLLGQGQSMAGDPFNLITIAANGASWAWDVRFVLARWLLAAGLGFVAWQATRQLSVAVLCALGGGFLGFFTYRLDHPANFSVAYSPWLLVAWFALAQAGNRRREYAALALLLVAHLVEFSSGTVKESVVLIAMLDLAGAMILLLLAPHAVRVRRCVGAVAVGVLFALLSAPLWWSFLDALHHSYTGYDVPHADQLPLGQLIGLFDDIFYRQNTVEEWVSGPALNFLFLGGVLAWLCFGVCGPRPATPDPARRAALAAAGAAFVCLAVGFGIVPARWVEAVPFLGNIVHVGSAFSGAMIVLLVVVAAVGFSDLRRGARAGGWWARCGLGALVLTVLLAAWYVHPARVGLSAFCRAYGLSLIVALAALLLTWRWRATAGNRSAWRVACILALPLLLWRHGEFGRTVFSHYAFVPGERVQVHANSAAVRAINDRRTEPTRIIGFGTNLFPGYAAALGWESLYGVDALRNRWYHELVAALHLERVWRWDEPDAEADAAQIRPAHDLLNVRYSLADHAEPARPLAGLTRIAAADLDVYESATAWPRAFFTDRVIRCDNAEDFARLVRAGDGHPFAAVEKDTPVDLKLVGDLRGRTIQPASDYRLTANTTRFAITAPGPGVAVLTETYYPDDFRVTIDGHAAPYFRVNHAFKGVVIPSAGRHEIAMTYWPQHFTSALRLGAAGLTLLLGAIGFAAWDVRTNRDR